MRKILVVALPVGLAVLAGILLFTTAHNLSESADARLERARLKRDFTERAQAAKAIPPDRLPEWQAEVTALSRWYFDELTAIRNRHPGEPPRPSGVQAADEGKRKKEEREALADFQAYAESRLQLLREERYAPIASTFANELQLDLISIVTKPSPDSDPELHIDFTLWGTPHFLEHERSN